MIFENRIGFAYTLPLIKKNKIDNAYHLFKQSAKIVSTMVVGAVCCPICYERKIKFDNKTFAPICSKCGWKGNMEDLITKEEATARKRTKLIDKMLQ
jgi:hypothetical protein